MMTCMFACAIELGFATGDFTSNESVDCDQEHLDYDFENDHIYRIIKYYQLFFRNIMTTGQVHYEM